MRVAAYSLYRYVYALLDTVTPCKLDCGKRCGSACCAENDVGTGMYLYPGEACMYDPLPSWARIEPSGFYYGKKEADILTCPGTCVRALRPLACRIFPLVPYKKAGKKMRVIWDPRSVPLCPLLPGELLPQFTDAVIRAMRIMVKTEEGRCFIEAQTHLIDTFLQMRL